MNHESGEQTLQWPGAEQLDALASIQDMDFANFLDIGELDLTAFSPLGHDGHVDATHDMAHMGESQSQRQQPDAMVHDFAADPFQLPMAMDHDDMLLPGHNVPGHDAQHLVQAANNAEWAHQQHSLPQNMHPQTYQPPQHVPPTPNSYDLHGGNPGRYLQQQMDPQTRSYLEQRYQLKKDDAMSFTPLVSPAVTPQDSRFQQIPEYTIPGAYFSPLTSPALQAQNAPQQHQVYGYNPNPSTAASSVATSPIDLNMDVDMTGINAAFNDPQRKSRRKTQTSRSGAPSARVRQSPIVKAQQKRKSTHLSSVIPHKDVQNILREAQHAASPPGGATLFKNAPFVDSSGTESISPEPLSESIMGPPPRPASAVQSPALLAQSQSAPASVAVNGTSGAPATPASLMSLKRSRQLALNQGASTDPNSIQSHAQISDDATMFDDFALPPAANEDIAQRSVLERIVMSSPSVSADATPRLIARKTPNSAPSGTPGSAMQTQSAAFSPAISAIASPAIAATPSSVGGRKSESKTSRGSKSRAGSSSVLISPAIRPKISPSIKPLLPDGAKLNESQQALLLASKSNYTHILEGTLLPGVTYPESLSSGLTSKRTSHKIAEQGRRNRINDALKEMQALLPKAGGIIKSPTGIDDKSTESLVAVDEEDGDKDSSKPGNSSDSKSASSKAATVESAIEYIKALQLERMQTVNVMKAKDAELAVLRQKLHEAELAANGSRRSSEQPEVGVEATE